MGAIHICTMYEPFFLLYPFTPSKKPLLAQCGANPQLTKAERIFLTLCKQAHTLFEDLRHGFEHRKKEQYEKLERKVIRREKNTKSFYN